MFVQVRFQVLDATYNNNHILNFGCSTQQQKAIMFHSEGKFLNPKPLIYLFLVLGT
jgi:type IV pilus biogenesis protein CpaD/CtpE